MTRKGQDGHGHAGAVQSKPFGLTLAQAQKIVTTQGFLVPVQSDTGLGHGNPRGCEFKHEGKNMNDKIALFSGYEIQLVRSEGRPDHLILVMNVQHQDSSVPSKFELKLEFSQAIQLGQSLREAGKKLLQKDVH